MVWETERDSNGQKRGKFFAEFLSAKNAAERRSMRPREHWALPRATKLERKRERGGNPRPRANKNPALREGRGFYFVYANYFNASQTFSSSKLHSSIFLNIFIFMNLCKFFWIVYLCPVYGCFTRIWLPLPDFVSTFKPNFRQALSHCIWVMSEKLRLGIYVLPHRNRFIIAF